MCNKRGFYTMQRIETWRQTVWGQILELFFLLMLVFLVRTFGFGLYQVPSGSMETTMLVGERFFADKLSYWFRPPVRGEIIAFNQPTYQYSKNSLKKLIEMYVWGPDNWTKRVIGIPGDHVRGTVEDGKPVIYLNGVKLEEPYLNKYPLVKETIIDSNNRYKKYEKKSYDPSKPFDNQPFYAVDPQRLLRDADGAIHLEYPDQAEKSYRGVPEGSTRFYGNNADEFNVKLRDGEYWVMGDNRRGSGDSRSFGPIQGATIHGRIKMRIWSIDSSGSWWIVDFITHPIDFWKKMRWNRFFQVVR